MYSVDAEYSVLEYHGVFVTNTIFLRVTPCTPWLFFFGIIRFFSLDSLLVPCLD
jgi:hypothetical protein